MHKKMISGAMSAGVAILLASCSVDDFLATATAGNSDTTVSGKVVLGLKTALKLGIDSSSLSASKINGYLANKAIKILLPQEAEQALATAEKIGGYVAPFKNDLQAIQEVVDFTGGVDQNAFQSNLSNSGSLLTELAGLEHLSDSLILYMNRAAEYAAPRSVPIFKNAITSITITDGLSLLNSSDSTAATSFLSVRTFDPLKTSYTPIVDSTLSLVPLTKYWGDFRTTYNSVLSRYNGLLAFQTAWNKNAVVASISDLQVNALKPVVYDSIRTESLGAWTTGKALGGLFYLVGQEEKDIRRDPFAYIQSLASDISDLLGEVFGEIMKMDK